MFLRTLLALSCLFHISLQRSTPQDDHYIAAVVEYGVTRNVAANLEAYTKLIKDASDQSADIVVFPELTLTNSSTSFEVPVNGLLREYPVPALHPDLYDNLLVSISSAARNNGIYVVINTRERVDCVANNTNEVCPEPKVYTFNTNVVFDRNGAVIDRYRKINLFGEASHTPALSPDLGIFETDFGVTFGHFICFDLMFQVPAIQVVQKHKLKDVVFTTMWFSELPYLTAVQIQEAYAYSMDINFLASGANNPAVGSAGSGIYSGKAGALISIMPGVPTTRLLVSKVPKVPGLVKDPVPGPIYEPPSEHDGLKLIQDPSLTAHISRPLVAGSQEFTLTDKDVSCNFKVKLDMRDGETAPYYRAVVQDGSNTYSKRQIGVAACSVVACKTTEFKSCTYRFDPKQTKSGIKELEIKMRSYNHQYNNTLDCDNVMYFPLSFTASKYPLAPINITFIDTKNDSNDIDSKDVNDSKKVNLWKLNIDDLENGEENAESDDFVCKKPKDESEIHEVILKINKPQDELQTFGVWGRIYTRDVDHNNKESSEEDVQGFDDFLDVIYEASDKNVSQ